MEIINKINNEIGGDTRDGLLNNIFKYYDYEYYRIKKIPERFRNAYTQKKYLKIIKKIKIKNGKLYKTENTIHINRLIN